MMFTIFNFNMQELLSQISQIFSENNTVYLHKIEKQIQNKYLIPLRIFTDLLFVFSVSLIPPSILGEEILTGNFNVFFYEK
jgi:hypothetical protein